MIENLWENPELYFTWVLVVMFSICLHEAAHAWTAAWRGDATAAGSGFLTLNPLRVMGPFSMVMLAVVGIAWGAVPVNRAALRNRWNAGLVSFAGPAANLLLAAGFAVALGILLLLQPHVRQEGLLDNATAVVSVGIQANLFLFLFNMIPVPMLDGYDVAAMFVPALTRWRERAGGAATLVVILLIMSPAGRVLWTATDVMAKVMVGGVVLAVRPWLG